MENNNFDPNYSTALDDRVVCVAGPMCSPVLPSRMSHKDPFVSLNVVFRSTLATEGPNRLAFYNTWQMALKSLACNLAVAAATLSDRPR